MNKYIGKICPYCKTEFTETDEIVVCSDCEMPHHKECWVENQGCTTFGCSGTIRGIEGEDVILLQPAVTPQPEVHVQPTATPQPEVYVQPIAAPQPEINVQPYVAAEMTPQFCSKCGKKLITGAKFCDGCGSPVGNQNYSNQTNYGSQINYDNHGNLQQNSFYQKVDSVIGQVKNGFQSAGVAGQFSGQPNGELPIEMQVLVGTKAEYYMPRFQQFKSTGKNTSWNWGAFFFTAYWCFYRKMIIPGVSIMAIYILSALLLKSALLGMVFSILLGIFGNYLYMFDLEQRIIKGRQLQEPLKTQFFAKNNGVDMTYAIISMVAYFVVCLVILI